MAEERVVEARKNLGLAVTNYLYACQESALETSVHLEKRNLYRIEGALVALRLAGKISEEDLWVLEQELEAPIRQRLSKGA